MELPRLEKYEIVELLSKGGMGEVFLARRFAASELCVLKLSFADRSLEPEVRARMLREAQVASLLSHPHIARLLDAGYEAERLYLAFELVPGQEISEVLRVLAARGERLPLPLALAIGLAVLEALQYAHTLKGPEGETLGIVHRDLSTRNVMVAQNGAVQVIDFGAVRADIGRYRTEPGVIVGTPFYMSPEQAAGEAVDHRSDLYSWTAVMFEMITGQRLAEGSQIWGVMQKIIVEPAPRLSEVEPSVPPALDVVFERALAKQAGARFQSAAELAAALRAAAGGAIGDPARAAEELGALVTRLFPEHLARIERWLAATEVLTPVATQAEVIGRTGRAHPASSPSPPPSPPPATRAVRSPRAKVAAAVLAAVAAVMLAVAFTPRAPMPVEARAVESERPPQATPVVEETAVPVIEDPPPANPGAPPERTRRARWGGKVAGAEEPAPPIAAREEPAGDALLAPIRARLEAGDPSSLEAAADLIEAAGPRLAPAQRAQLKRCLERRITAPSTEVMREMLSRCLALLSAALSAE